MSPSRYQKVSWRSGLLDVEPSSVVQSMMLSELKPRCLRRFYNMQNHIRQQVQKSRALSNVNDGQTATNGKKINMPKGIHCERKMKQKSRRGAKSIRSPHMILTPSSGGKLSILDGKIVWRYLKRKDGNIALVAFGEVQPSPEGEIRELFCISTEERNLKDRDRCKELEHAPSLLGTGCDVSEATESDSVEPLLMTLMNDDYLEFRSFDVRKSREAYRFPIKCSAKFNHVVSFCEDSRIIVLANGTGSLPKGIVAEFLILKYPNLAVAARMQISSSVRAGSKNSPKTFTICLPFLVGYVPNGSVELYDLFKLLEMSNRSDALMIEELSVTHEVKELPKPITINAGITRSEDYWELYTHCNPGFCVVKNQNGCQLFEITEAGSKEVNCELIKKEAVETVGFMQNAAPRVVCVGASSVRVFEVVLKETNKGRIASHVIQIFPVPEQETFAGNEVTSSNEGRRPRRARPKVSYAAFRNSKVLWKQNLALGQVAIVTLEVGEVSCSVYDSENFQLLYRIKPEHFKPTETEIEDSLDLVFANNLIAVQREGYQKNFMYVFNIYHSVAADIG